MIDLHMHTTYSDGTDSLTDVLSKCEEKKLNIISITDHNTVDGYFEMEKINVNDYFSGKIVCGIELNTKACGVPIEILGYNIDYNKMSKLANKTYLKPEKRNEVEFGRLVDKCKKAGFVIDDDVIEKFDNTKFTSGQIHKSITNHIENKPKLNEKSWNSARDFYRDYMSNPSTPLYVEMEDLVPDLNTAIDLVKESNGLVFIPHIYEYRANTPKVLDYILKNGRLDGIECYYTTFTKEQHEYLMNLTEEKHLLRSGGSDYHGTIKPDTDIGIGHGNMQIPESIAIPWAKFLEQK